MSVPPEARNHQPSTKYEHVLVVSPDPQSLMNSLKELGDQGYYISAVLPILSSQDGKQLMPVIVERPKSLIEIPRGAFNLS